MAALSSFRKLKCIKFTSVRTFSLKSKTNVKKGVVVGAYTTDKGDFKLTPTAESLDKCLAGALKKNLALAGIERAKSRLFYGLSPEYDVIAVVGLGKEDVSYNETEEIDEKREDIRIAAGVGAKCLQDVKCANVSFDDFGDAEAAAEGATLALWTYQDWKEESKQKKSPTICSMSNDQRWDIGVLKGNAQNFCRKLTDSPANYMTPTKFSKIAKSEMCGLGVEVNIYDQEWATSMKMGSFLCVAQGSMEPLKFVEMIYKGGNQSDKPVVLVGKGVTFDSGGISLKPALKMDEMRGDMGGAACVLACIHAVASLKLPINLIGLTPLCENLGSGSAVKPGDIVTAMNGKNIQVDNTDAEGRLILADALCYAKKFQPTLTLDIATLTGAMRVALGGVLSGVFSNSNCKWEEIRKAGIVTGDRMWRFPLYKEYTTLVTDFKNVDLNNIGKGTGGGACTAAAFLKEFAPPGDWMHIDIAGVSGPDNEIPYLNKGMTGRPTRTLIQFINQLACPR